MCLVQGARQPQPIPKTYLSKQASIIVNIRLTVHLVLHMSDQRPQLDALTDHHLIQHRQSPPTRAVSRCSATLLPLAFEAMIEQNWAGNRNLLRPAWICIGTEEKLIYQIRKCICTGNSQCIPGLKFFAATDDVISKLSREEVKAEHHESNLQ